MILMKQQQQQQLELKTKKITKIKKVIRIKNY